MAYGLCNLCVYKYSVDGLMQQETKVIRGSGSDGLGGVALHR